MGEVDSNEYFLKNGEPEVEMADDYPDIDNKYY